MKTCAKNQLRVAFNFNVDLFNKLTLQIFFEVKNVKLMASNQILMYFEGSRRFIGWYLKYFVAGSEFDFKLKTLRV